MNGRNVRKLDIQGRARQYKIVTAVPKFRSSALRSHDALFQLARSMKHIHIDRRIRVGFSPRPSLRTLPVSSVRNLSFLCLTRPRRLSMGEKDKDAERSAFAPAFLTATLRDARRT